ncbi:PhnA protein [uncultured Ilyobacter sp.]|uniref:PhnA protein n=1 Tax=uncultured Ilyobacter sp. TaxID=544433 RepID=UPI0029C7C82B|nr:PhnA protein [uncultured Ilyobacter sp.]
MAKGLDRDRERKSKVLFFGKDLARRSKSSCELCEAKNEKLEIYEVPPATEEPDFDRCMLICEHCKKILNNFNKAGENDLRFLNSAVWSEVPIVKALAIYALRKIRDKYNWAEETLETVYIEEEIEAFLDKIEL